MPRHNSLAISGRCFVGCVLLFAAVALGQESPSSTSQKQLMQQRDRFEFEAQRLKDTGNAAQSLEKVRQMLATERQMYGADHEDIVGSLIWIAEELTASGDFRGAVASAREATEMLTRLHGADAEKTVNARTYADHLEQLARLDEGRLRAWREANQSYARANELNQRRDYEQASDAAQQALSLYRQSLGDDSLDTAKAWSRLARACQQLPDIERAIDASRRGHAIRLTKLGANHSEVRNGVELLSDLYEQQIATLVRRGDLRPTNALLDDWAGVLRQAYGNDYWEHRYVEHRRQEIDRLAELPPDQLRKYIDGVLQIDQARQSKYSGKVTDAEKLLRQALNDLQKLVGTDDRNYLLGLQLLVECLANDQLEERVRLQRQFVEIYDKSFGPDNPRLKLAQNQLANLLKGIGSRQFDRGEIDAAVATSGELLAIYEKLYGSDDAQTKAAQLNLQVLGDYSRLPADQLAKALDAHQKAGQLVLLSGQQREWDAVQLAQSIVDVRREIFGDQHPEYISALRSLAAIYVNLDDHDRAVASLRKVVDLQRRTLGSDHSEFRDNLDLFTAELHMLAGRNRVQLDLAAELPLRQELVDRLVELTGDSRWQVRQARAWLAETDRLSHLSDDDLARFQEARRREESAFRLFRDGQASQALPLIEYAAQTHRDLLGELSPSYLQSLDVLADTRAALGSFEQAGQDYRSAVELAKKSYGEADPSVVARLRALANFAKDREDWQLQQESLWQALLIGREVFGRKHGTTADLRLALEEGLRWGELTAAQRTAAKQADEVYQKAVTLARRGDSLAAFDEASRAYDQYRTIYGDRWPGYGRSLRLLANLQHDLYHFDDAQRHYVLTLRHYDDWMAGNCRAYIDTLSDLADLFAERKDLDDAERARRQVLDLELQLANNRSWRVGQSMERLERTERLGKAEQRESRRLKDADRFERQSAAALAKNDLDEGVRLARKAIEIRSGLVGTLREDDLGFQNRLTDFAELLVSVGHQHLDRHQFQLARASLQESLMWLSRAYPPGHWRLKRAAYDLAEVQQWENLEPGQLAALDEARQLQTTGATDNPEAAERVVSLLTQALGPRHLRTLHAEFQYLRMVRDILGLDEAATRLQAVVTTRRELLGDDNPATRDAMTALASVYRSQSDMLEQRGDLAAAEAAMRQALPLQQSLFGANSPPVTLDQAQLNRIVKISQLDDSQRTKLYAARQEMNDLGRRMQGGDFAEAIRISDQWQSICREIFGDASSEYAMALQTAGDVRFDADQLGPALADLRQAWEISLKSGDLVVHQIPITNSLIRAMRTQSQQALEAGDWKRAADICRELLVCEQTVFGPEHWMLRTEKVTLDDILRIEKMSADDRDRLKQAAAARQLAQKLKDQGNQAAAMDQLQQSVKTLESVWGSDHHQVAESMGLLADWYVEKGWFDVAEPLYRRATQASWSAYGSQNAQTIRLLGQLGHVYGMLGDLSRANWHLNEAIQAYQQTSEVASGPAAPNDDFATLCTNFLDVLDRAIDTVSAEDVNASADQISFICQNAEQIANVDHPLFVRARLSRAKLLAKRGLLAEAEQLLSETAAALAKEKPELDVELNLARAEYAAAQGKLAAAEELLNQVVSQQEKRPDTVWFNSSRCLNQLAMIYQATGRRTQALETLDKCLQREQDRLGTAFIILNERQALDQLNLSNRTLKMLLSIAADSDATPADKELAFNWVVRRKGILFDSLCQFRRQQVARSNDPQIQNLVTRLDQLRQHLATATIRPEQGLLQESQFRQQDWLNDQIQRQESELRRILAERTENRQELQGPAANAASVRASLPAGVSMVEFVRSEPFDFQATGSTDPWQPAHYYAFVLNTADDAPVTLINLGPAAEIDSLVEETREQLALGASGKEQQREADYRLAAQALYRRVFQPLETAIGQASTIYLAPDSELNRIGFETLVDDDEKYLVERFLIAYVTSGRDLLRSQASLAQGTIVFADPDFTANAPVPVEPPDRPKSDAKNPPVNTTNAPTDPGSLSRDARGRDWKRLPGTEGEATDLERLLKPSPLAPVTVYLGNDALEETFKRIRAPRVLHVATHGYFFEDELAQPSGEPSTTVRGGAGVTAGYDRLRHVENPLLRSGLVLTGANRIANNDSPYARSLARSPDTAPAGSTTQSPPRLIVPDDGWLTAEEISSLDLRGTDLVVLSACQTGLGDIRTGEGVQGLRRAFFYAGASTLVTSLYSVPDSNTRDFMRAFYQALIQGKSKTAALHDAQLKMLQQRRGAGQAAHPYFWGSFILIGPT